MARDYSRAISERVERLRRAEDPCFLARLPSGFAILAKYQPEGIVGGCMLLPDPVVPSANHLSGAARERFFADMVQLGDALLAATGAERINYLVLCNQVPELHAHCIPRFAHEDARKRLQDPFEAYDFGSARVADPIGLDRDLVARLRASLGTGVGHERHAGAGDAGPRNPPWNP
jgi:diadenosine tetraphosphate (Ap4A) HIT family hydrolase